MLLLYDNPILHLPYPTLPYPTLPVLHLFMQPRVELAVLCRGSHPYDRRVDIASPASIPFHQVGVLLSMPCVDDLGLCPCVTCLGSVRPPFKKCVSTAGWVSCLRGAC